MVGKATSATKTIGETTTCKEELIQLKTKYAIEIIVILIEDQNEKIWKKIDSVVAKIDNVADVITKPRDEESKQ